MQKTQLSCYLPCEVSRLLKVELARRAVKFSHWVEAKAREELGAEGEPAMVTPGSEGSQASDSSC